MRVRRIGAPTAGMALIAFGLVLLSYTFWPNLEILTFALRLWPVLLVSLGIEVLINAFRSGDSPFKYDFASVLLMLLSVGFAFACEIVRQILIYEMR